jgi:aryl-alcohol dehydrogenase-like predicted oxidoreductase
MEITRVGFGAWAIGGPDWAVGWGAQDDQASIAAIRHAVARGIDWINTAAIYGLGHSEIVRQALAEIPVGERPYVFTKCGLVRDENNRQAPPRRVGLPASIRREVTPRSNASVSSASISTRCTGQPRMARRSMRIGRRFSI